MLKGAKANRSEELTISSDVNDRQVDQLLFSNEDTRSPAVTSTTNPANACVPRR